MKLWIYYIGRPKEAHSNALAAEYVKRASRYMDCGMREIDPRRFDVPARHTAATKVFLDPAGKLMDTAGFVELVRAAEYEARDLVFLIGGHDGLPATWKPKADLLLGLTPMTLPHELARALLAEQIYRALATLRGHPYPR
ncbi:MAG: 50S rRNA methyltransferase [Candidatus Solibacter sp.]|nr:50S rRNA methyltransferase [Candidatus Solibacter sp.]